ncbi:MAG: M56 family metallopeptidase [bacterium]|nr:M56 family metallopeptidase [bacterium]MCM1375790.1 M56 family metallopeptidase [Muribaculum sp.]
MDWHAFLPALLNMSLTASLVILVVLFARLLLRRAPKIFSYILWLAVLLRLFCPVALSSPLSLLGMLDAPAGESRGGLSSMQYIEERQAGIGFTPAQIAVPRVDDGRDELDGREGQPGSRDIGVHAGRFDTVASSLVTVLVTCAWGAGFLGMIGYGAFSLCRIRRKLRVAIPLRDNIFLADDIQTPFVIGMIRPRIYLPCGLSDKEQSYIVLHEQHHIKRFDHIIKALAFLALCIHWFNPLVWLAFVFSGRDMEMSCDEAVIRKMGEDIRADYSALLLALATGRRVFAGAPLAFGEGDTGGRIRNLANWRRPAFWAVLAAVVGCVVLTVCLLTNPADGDERDGRADAGHAPEETTGRDSGGGTAPEPGTDAEPEGNMDHNLNAGAAQGEEGSEDSGEPAPVRRLSIGDLEHLLTEKGDKLSWGDFAPYVCEDVGSGLYILRYEIDKLFSVYVGGNDMTSEPTYIYLQADGEPADSLSTHHQSMMLEDSQQQQTEDRIDIRYEDMWTFINRICETYVRVVAYADLDHDGESEVIAQRTICPGMEYGLVVQKLDGTQIWEQEAALAHVGWNTVLLYSEGGEDYLVQYQPTMYQGMGNYICRVFSLEGGGETVKEEWSVDYMLPVEETAEMTAFAEEVGLLLEKCKVLLSTEEGILVDEYVPASDIPWLYPVRFDPDEIEEAVSSAADRQESASNAVAYPQDTLEMLFASGAGAWGTNLTLKPDGSFTGSYSSTEAHTIRICEFSGRFGEPVRISDYAFSMRLEELTTEEQVGIEWDEGEFHYITSDALGIAGGEEFILYAPGIPADELPEECRNWWPAAWRWREGSVSQLDGWGLYNVKEEAGFFTSWFD